MALPWAIIDDENLMCPLCFEQYQEPEYLPCVHSFSEKSLKIHLKAGRVRKRGTGIHTICPPLCCTEFEKPQGPSNSNILKAIPTNENTERHIQDTNHEQIKEVMCFPCQCDGNNVKATYWCFDCEFAICDLCKNFHAKFPTMISHRVCLLTKKTPSIEASTEFCPDHKHEKLDMYCCTHHKPCCEICSVTEHRNCLSVVTLDIAVQQFADPTSIGSLKDLLDESNQRMTLLKENRKQNIVDLQVSKVDIDNHMANLRSEVDRYLDRIQREFNSNLDNLHKRTVSLLQNQISEFESEKEKLLDSKTSLDISVNRRSKLLKMKEVERAKDLERQTRRFIVEMEKQMRRLSYKEVLKTISAIQSDIPSLGSVKLMSEFIQNISLTDLSKKYPLQHEKSFMIEPTNEITGMTFLPTGDIICCIYQDKRLCRYRYDGKLASRYVVEHNPFDITLFSDVEVIVTFPLTKCLQILNIGNMTPTQHIEVSQQFYGVCCRLEKIYLSHAHGIVVINSRGFEEQKYAFDIGPEKYINVKMSGEILFTSPSGLHSISTNGEQKKVFDKTVPLFGVTSDYDGQIYVASGTSAIMLSDRGCIEQNFHLKHRCRAIAFGINRTKIAVSSTDTEYYTDTPVSRFSKRRIAICKTDERNQLQKHHLAIYDLTDKGSYS